MDQVALAPWCDLCVRSGVLRFSTMSSETRLDAERKPIPGDAFRCQTHHTRQYHPHVGYISDQTKPFEDLPPSFQVECGNADCSAVYMFISSARSPNELTLRCAL